MFDRLDRFILLEISRLTDFDNVHTFFALTKRSRHVFLANVGTIIFELLCKFGPKKLPRWCFLSIPLFPFDETLATNILQRANERGLFDLIPNYMNIEKPMIAGGAITQLVFDHGWFSNDIDVFCGFTNGVEPIAKRAKTTLHYEEQTRVVDFVFRNIYISDFDISVCQVGICLNTKKVFVTPLFLYSYKYNVLVCRISTLRTGYLGAEDTTVMSQFDYHVEQHNRTGDLFHRCRACKSDCKRMGVNGIVGIWRRRVKKYADRFPNYTIKFVGI
jgi:hypothetical protein